MDGALHPPHKRVIFRVPYAVKKSIGVRDAALPKILKEMAVQK